ncbi:HNH endonuclease signature motif containing protein [Sinomonas albida]|uniref:HNH endonuclease signature motif containing protein n=1 Tax=Sinomonas albida TaxID=369942 RepID=UPI003015C55F
MGEDLGNSPFNDAEEDAASGAPSEPLAQEPATDGPSQPQATEPATDGPSEPQALSAAVKFEAAMFEVGTAFVDGLVETAKALEAHEARLHALRAFVLSELCEHFRRGARDRLEAAEAPALAAAEIAAALNVSQRTGRAMVEEARTLADPGLAPVLDALRDGRLDRRRARAVVEHAAVLPPGKDAEFAAAAVEIGCPQGAPGPALSPGAFSRRLRRLAEGYHPEPLAARKAHAVAFRRVDLEPTRDGMCWITAHLPLEAGAAIDARLEAIARSLQTPAEVRGINQLRADAFRDLLLDGPLVAESVIGAPLASTATPSGATRTGATAGTIPTGATAGTIPTGAMAGAVPTGAMAEATPSQATPSGAIPTGATAGTLPAQSTRALDAGGTGSGVAPGASPGGIRTEIVVTVPARTLTGESDAPAEILGYGALDAPAARQLAAQASTWTTMWVDPDSRIPLALGRRRYTPTLAIRRFLGARDRTCRFPGCDKPAPSTEADHTTPWQHGGTTDAANLALLCREHHRLKSLGHWKLRQLEPTPADKPDSSAVAAPAPHPNLGMGSEPAPPEAGPEQGKPPTAVQTAPPPPGGTLEWTSPTGRKYLTHPETDAPPPF